MYLNGNIPLLGTSLNLFENASGPVGIRQVQISDIQFFLKRFGDRLSSVTRQDFVELCFFVLVAAHSVNAKLRLSLGLKFPHRVLP